MTNSTYYSGSIPFIRSAEIRGDKTVLFISERGLTESSAKMVKIGDILYALYGATSGTVSMSKINGAINQAILDIVPYAEYDSKFIIEWLTFKKEKIVGKFLQGGQGNLSASIVNNIKIDFPEYIEQKKIGQILTKLDDLLAIQRNQLSLYEGIRMGIFKKLFPTEVNESPKINFSHADKSWKKQLLLSYINRIIDFRGKTPKKLGMDWSKDGILALSALNVKQGYIDKKVDAHFGNESLYDKWMIGKELYKGQVLMTTEAPMGNVAQVPDNDKYILSQRTIAFDVNDKKITNDFLALILKNSKTFNDLSALSSGGTAKGISQRSLSELKITVPKSIEYQKYISKILNEIDNLIALQKDEVNKINNLKKYYLQKLFI